MYLGQQLMNPDTESTCWNERMPQMPLVLDLTGADGEVVDRVMRD